MHWYDPDWPKHLFTWISNCITQPVGICRRFTYYPTSKLLFVNKFYSSNQMSLNFSACVFVCGEIDAHKDEPNIEHKYMLESNNLIVEFVSLSCRIMQWGSIKIKYQSFKLTTIARTRNWLYFVRVPSWILRYISLLCLPVSSVIQQKELFTTPCAISNAVAGSWDPFQT